jgi:aryl-alcohol dehydrogenase-like predicted oxidoreductase
LRRLGLDAVPLYQIHWPDGTTRWDDCMGELEACRVEGKVRHIGACNLSWADVQACQRTARLESLQMPFSLAEPDHAEVMAQARGEWQMSTLSYNVLAHGLFSGKYTQDSVFSGTDLRSRVPLLQEPRRGQAFELLDRIRRVAEMSQRSCVQVALAWTLAHPSVSVAIVGTRTAAQIEESAGTVDSVWFDQYRDVFEPTHTIALPIPS